MTEQDGKKDPMMTDGARSIFPDSTQSKNHESGNSAEPAPFQFINYQTRYRQPSGEAAAIAQLFQFPAELNAPVPTDPTERERLKGVADEFIKSWVEAGKEPKDAYDAFPSLADYLPKNEAK